MDNMNLQPTQEITKKKKWLLPVLLGAVALVLVAAGIGGFVYIKSVALPRKELQKKLDLADKYLTDMDYENAIFAYKQAISINPKSEEAYLGLGRTALEYADLLVEEGDVDEAINVLKGGIKALKPGVINTDSSEIQDTLDELNEKKDELEERRDDNKNVTGEPATSEVVEEIPFQSIDVSMLPSGLTEFLEKTDIRWMHGTYYDCESEESVLLAVEAIFDPYLFCDYSLYRDYFYFPDYQDYYTHSEYFYEEGIYTYWYLDEKGMDWILINIYNIDDTMLEKVKKANPPQNGKYIGKTLGIGGPDQYVVIKEAETNNSIYHITYEIHETYGDIDDEEYVGPPQYAILEYKIIDGKGYWTIYKNSDQPIF